MNEKVVIFLTFVSSCVALALLAGSMGSDYWVVATAKREANDKSEGKINFGLFKGTRRLNHGFGVRVYEMDVLDAQYRQKDFLVRELYVTTVASACGACLLGVAAACLALHNVATTPTEAACTYPGLIALSVVTFAFSLTSVVTWLAQYVLRLRKNVLIREDVLSGGWNSAGRASLGFSFWMLLAVAAIFFVNSSVYFHLQKKRSRMRDSKAHIIESATKPNANLMLY